MMWFNVSTYCAWQARPENRSQPSTIFNHNRWIAKIKTVLQNSIVEWSFYLLARCWWEERRICGRQYLCVCCFFISLSLKRKSRLRKHIFRGVVLSYIPGTLGESWGSVAPLVLVLAFVGCLNPTVLFWESSAPSAFSPPTTTAVALPVCTNVSLLIRRHK